MIITKNKHSVAVAVKDNGKVYRYLSARDEEKGLDIQLDLRGYTVKAL